MIPAQSKFCIKCGHRICVPIILEILDSDESIDYIEKGYMLLNEKKFELAQQCFDKGIEKAPNESKAFLGKLLAQLQFDNIAQLPHSPTPLEKNPLFIKAVDCANPPLKNRYKIIAQENIQYLADQDRLLRLAHEEFVKKCALEVKEEERKKNDLSVIHGYLAQIIIGIIIGSAIVLWTLLKH